MPNQMPAPPIHQGTAEVTFLTSVDPLPATVADHDAWRTGLIWRSTADVLAETQAYNCTAFEWSAYNTLAIPDIDPFLVGVVHGCDGHVNETEYRAEAEAALEAKQAWLIAREVWMGADHAESLQSAATTVSGTGDPLDVIDNLIQNHQDATKGGRSVVHVPRTLLGLLDDRLTRVGNRLQLADGTVVIPGPGYPTGSGAYGPDGASQTASQQWIYVTGPIEAALSPITTFPTRTPDQNQVTVYVQRAVIARFDPTFVMAGLATLS